MTTGEIIKKLITTQNYLEVRMGISDEFIEFVKAMLPDNYEYFREKEEAYQEALKHLKDFNI
jgi:hypothetical protein